MRVLSEIKLNNIKGIQNFTWEIEKSGNLVFAKNGVGKSSISSALYLISQLQLEENVDDKNVLYDEYKESLKKLRPINTSWGNSKIEVVLNDKSLYIEFNDTSIIELSIIKESPKLHIFCEEFTNKMNPSFSQNKDFAKPIKVNITDDDTELESKKQELNNRTKELKNILGKDENGEVYNTLGFSRDLEELHTGKQTYWDNIKEKIYTGNTDNLSTENSSDIEQKIKDLDKISIEDIKIEEKETIKSHDLSTLPDLIKKGYSNIDTVLSDLGLDWSEKTKSVLEESDICPACETELSVENKNKAIKRLSNLIESERASAEQQLNKIKEDVKKIDSKALIYSISKNMYDVNAQGKLLGVSEIFTEEPDLNIYVKSIEDAQTALKQNIDSKLQEHMESKITDIDGLDIHIKALQGGIENFNTYIIDIYNKYVKELKTKADSTKTQKTNLNEIYVQAKLREKIEEHIKKETYTQIKTLETEIDTLETEIATLETKTQNERKFLSLSKNIFNELLKQLGCERFQINDSGKLVLNDTLVDSNHKNVLSTGEKNIINLTYYWVSSLSKVNNEEEAKNLVFVMDDPVSSFDYNNLYNIASAFEYYKKEYLSQYETNNIGKGFRKVKNEGKVYEYPNKNSLILTHDATFYTILSNNVFKQKAKYFELSKSNNNLNAKTSFKKQSMLKLHLLDIDNFISDNTAERKHTIANSIRSVLEIAQDIECDENELSDYIKKRMKKGSITKQVANALSHGKFADEPILNDSDQLKKICKEVKEYFKDNHKVNFCNLSKRRKK